MARPTLANIHNLQVLEELYERWRQDPDSVDSSWQHFFAGFEAADRLEQPLSGSESSVIGTAKDATHNELQIQLLIDAYREFGHLIADLNPLSQEAPSNPNLELSTYGFSEADLDNTFPTGSLVGPATASLRDIVGILKDTYCGSIGVEYMHIQNPQQRRWLQERLEGTRGPVQLATDARVRILEYLYKAEMFEAFLHRNFLGQKRFSLEGNESLITALDTVRERCPGVGIHDVVLGMPHRGRLTVLVTILDTQFEVLFSEFEEKYAELGVEGSGDVKYHLGTSCDYIASDGGKVHITLSSNPSHLEAVNPITLGRARAKQRRHERNRQSVLPVLLHGDAAFAGQGLVMETLQLSQLTGYGTGGTLHIVVNNQIGFTTTPDDGRSTRYATDIAKMFEAPVFHVNSADPEAVRFCVELAIDYRQTFGVDTFIDLIGYRKYGHNETDDPSYTQPQMYAQIGKITTARERYLQKLIAEKAITETSAQEMHDSIDKRLNDALTNIRKDREGQFPVSTFKGHWSGFRHEYSYEPVKTAVDVGVLDRIVQTMFTWPQGFNPNKKIVKQFERTQKAYMGATNGKKAADKKRGTVDWAMAESLAIGSLLVEGTPVRLSGQDSRRGTFSQRHSVLYDSKNGSTYIPLNDISEDQEQFCVYNSPLSEAGVLGFDYGYSLDEPKMLILWEAQFGDFVNGAQIIIDQFITSAEAKWQRASGLVMLLPHGNEGMGPEHSSARLERFLQASADDNITVCNLSTPAQYFHVLRRQVRRDFRKPLVIMTPKSLLRHKRCLSPVTDLATEDFSEILDDSAVDAKQVKRLLLCTGKVYYDLLESRESQKRDEVAIIRVEQVYPLHKQLLSDILGRYTAAEEIYWVQEETRNMGAWTFIQPHLQELTTIEIGYIGRDSAASPAVGSYSMHILQQQEIVRQSFAAQPQSVHKASVIGQQSKKGQKVQKGRT